MQFLYSFFLTLIFIALLPYFAFQAIFNRKYLSNLRERSGFLPDSLRPDSLRSDARPAIWMHAVSVGETLASLTLIRELRAQFPHHRLIVSTTTATGQAIARSKITEADGFCYYPFDWKSCVRRALDVIKPEIIVLMESELWFNFLSECKSREIPVVVANGRISDRSFSRSQKFGFFVRSLYRSVTLFAMQSQVDAERAIKLGAPVDRVRVTGNIKYDIGEAQEPSKTAETARHLDDIFALSAKPLIVAGSTTDGEEEIISSAFEKLRMVDGLEEIRLLVAPRHPERFDEVARLFDGLRMKYVRRSGNSADGRLADIVLLDSIGELAAIYQFASLVFVGGSLAPKGGHNILEPALRAKPIVVGPHMENFREIANEFLRRDAMIQIEGRNNQELIDRLLSSFTDLLSDSIRARELGMNARKAVDENRGATAWTVKVIAELIGI